MTWTENNRKNVSDAEKIECYLPLARILPEGWTSALLGGVE